MGLSASLWTSVSGLLAHGEKMNVVGNNLANVSTIGFKSQRMDFEDFIYKNQFTSGGTDQVGLGVGVNAIIGDFSQGAFELTNSATDLAIAGSGFFKVVNQSTGSDYYTRAGNFNFNAEGYLTLPSGEVLQGWQVDNNTNPLPASGINPVVREDEGIKTIGEATDIRLNTWTILPKATTKVDFSVNLSTNLSNDRSVSTDNPFFAMADNWNGKEAIENGTSPLSSEAYEYSAPIKVYDEGGKEHTLTTYFDRVPTENDEGESLIDGLPTGYQIYEYMLTMNPEDDARTFGGTYNETTGVLTGATNFKDTEAAGILMKGTMIFNSSGELVSQTAYTYMGNTDFEKGQTIKPLDANGDALEYGKNFEGTGGAVTFPTDPTAADYATDLATYNTAYDTMLNEKTLGHPDSDLSWQPTAVSDEGYPLFVANFSGQPMANAVGQSKTDTDQTRSKDANDIWIEFDLGLQSANPQSPWQTSNGSGGLEAVDRLFSSDGATIAGLSDGDGGSIAGSTPTEADKASIADMGITAPATAPNYLELATLIPNEAETGASTSVNEDSYTSFGSQDGYPAGDLTNVNIDADGVVFGIYSNGVNLPLYQIAMYDFVNPQGLYREGGNLFSETLESGSIQQAQAGIAGMGSINAYNIEQSNVDMTREFVQMIATQRGFQSNSKGITTVDTMLELVINMKR